MCKNEETLTPIKSMKLKGNASRQSLISIFPDNGHLLSQLFCPSIIVLRLNGGWQIMEYLEIWIFFIRDHGKCGRDRVFIPSVTTSVLQLQ